jgi:hypothetical protein
VLDNHPREFPQFVSWVGRSAFPAGGTKSIMCKPNWTASLSGLCVSGHPKLLTNTVDGQRRSRCQASESPITHARVLLGSVARANRPSPIA